VLTETLLASGEPPSATLRAVAVAEQLLFSCGVLDNDGVSALVKGLAPVADVKAALRAMEDQGVIRRGYFVDGAAGLQYATPEAVEALRAARHDGADDDDDVFVLCAVDPAQPFGADVPWPAPTSLRGPHALPPQRAASATAIIAAGQLVALVLGGGKKTLTFIAETEPERRRQARAAARGLAHLAARTPSARGRSNVLIVGDVDDLETTSAAFRAHPLAAALTELGFLAGAGGFTWPRAGSAGSRALGRTPQSAPLRSGAAPERSKAGIADNDDDDDDTAADADADDDAPDDEQT